MEKTLVINQGKTFILPIRWETEPLIYKPISGITKASPCVIHAPTHGVPSGWRVAVVSANGMTELNTQNMPPKDSDYFVATIVDADHIELNKVSSEGYKPYTSGGAVVYNTPHDLDGYEARMSIKDKIGGTELMLLDTNNLRIEVDNANKVITLTISATDTEAITWKKGVYDLELVSPTGVVSCLMRGDVSVVYEVTTP